MQNKLSLSDNKDKFFLAINQILYNSPYFKAKIFEFFDYDIEKVFLADKNDLCEFAEIYKDVSIPKSFLNEKANLDPDKIYEDIQNKGLKYLTYNDEKYPEMLKNIEDFPLLLFYKGNLDNVNFERTLGIVGSRKATESAKQNVKNLVAGLLNTDVTIVSGLAAGIDTQAHRAALDNNLQTVAVIGSGLDFYYPYQNKKLYKEIEDGGGVIFSEFPNGIRPMPVNFPQRNRIVTGLSFGVLIAEAKMKSGAMISARYALEQGKELMCIPGAITNPNCEGIYHLIKQGASIIVETQDILNALNWEIKPIKKDKIKLDGLKGKIYNLISLEEISTEGLKQNLDVDITELMINLTEMELEGTIIQKNGLYYIAGN